MLLSLFVQVGAVGEGEAGVGVNKGSKGIGYQYFVDVEVFGLLIMSGVVCDCLDLSVVDG